jgi:hypothetical protein
VCTILKQNNISPEAKKKCDATDEESCDVMTLGTEQICLGCGMPKNS